jgi:hypothetical protein
MSEQVDTVRQEDNIVRQQVDEHEHKNTNTTFLETFQILYNRMYNKGRFPVYKTITIGNTLSNMMRCEEQEYLTTFKYENGKMIIGETKVGKDISTSEKEEKQKKISYMLYINSMIEKLIVGANLNARNRKGCTPLMILFNECGGNHKNMKLTISKNTNKLVKLFIEHKADINAQDSHGMTALMYACFADELYRTMTVPTLIDAKANLDIQDKNGYTALHYASGDAMYNNTPIIEMLIDAGADINIKDKHGEDCIEHIQHEFLVECYKSSIARLKKIQSVKTCINEGYKAQDAIIISYLNSSSETDK